MSNNLNLAKALYAKLATEVQTRVPKISTWKVNIEIPNTDKDFLNAIVVQIGQIYLDLPEEERTELRQTFQDSETIWCLYLFAHAISLRLEITPNAQLYRLALAALSIADQTPDYRDWLYAVGYLVRAARECGLPDYLNTAKEIGAISSREGAESTSALLTNFEKTAVFQELLPLQRHNGKIL